MTTTITTVPTKIGEAGQTIYLWGSSSILFSKREDMHDPCKHPSGCWSPPIPGPVFVRTATHFDEHCDLNWLELTKKEE